MKSVVVFLVLAFLVPILGRVVTGAPEATPSTTSSGETQTGEIEGKIEEIRESIRKQVEEKMDQIIAERKKASWVGTIKKKETASLTLETKRGAREILVDEETMIVNRKSQEKTFEDLTEGKQIAALGYRQNENILEARRVIIIEKFPLDKSGSVGIISDKSQVENLIVVTPINDKDQIVEITIQFLKDSKQTKIIGADNKEVNYDALEKGKKIAAVFEKIDDKNNALLIKILD